MICHIGDKVLIRVKLIELKINKSTDYTELLKFDVIGEGRGCWIISIPKNKTITGSFEISSWDCGRYGIDLKYSNELGYVIQEEHIVKVYTKVTTRDGAFCDRCSEFIPMAEVNDWGGFKCYLCRTYKYR